MTEYIEREALEVALNHRLNFLMAENGEYDHYTSGFDEAVTRVENFPAADVVEVRHGRWEKHGSKWQCTGCKVLMSIDGTPQENLLYYCPNCGASMDKEVADETCIYQPCAE